jgi:hypothetical protein
MLEIKVIKTQNFSEIQIQKINNAVRKMEKVLNSKVFRYQVLAFTTQGKIGFSYKKNWFSSFEKYNNDHVYHFIMNPNKEKAEDETATIELYLSLDSVGASKTKEKGLPEEDWVYTNLLFFESAAESQLAGHFAHEWCHKLGFSHARYKWQDPNREYSVPYAIGNLVETLLS